MLKRINILDIIFDHFGTLRSLNQKSKLMNWKDFFLFIVFPLSISIYLTCLGYNFKEQLGNLIAAISIFGGFLFNLLAIIYSQIDNLEKDAALQKEKSKENFSIKERFVNEIHINISFCIVLSILIILTLLSTTIDIPVFKYDWIIEKTIICINYYLMSLFLLTLIMILNRVYILLNKRK